MMPSRCVRQKHSTPLGPSDNGWRARVRLLWQVMQDIADDFVENLAAFACELTQHRAGTTLEVKDVQLALGAQPAPSPRPRVGQAVVD